MDFIHSTEGREVQDLDDAINASRLIQYNEDGVSLVDTYIDGWLLSGQHGDVVDKFLDVIYDYLDKNS